MDQLHLIILHFSMEKHYILCQKIGHWAIKIEYWAKMC